MKESANRLWMRLWLGVVCVSAVLLSVGMVSVSWSGSYRSAAAFTPGSNKTPTVSTVGGMITPTTTRSWLTTPTTTLLRSTERQASQTSLISHVFIPVVEKDGNPLPFQARLPLLANTHNTSSNPEIPYTEKTILVDISEQHVYAYEKGKVIFSFVASTGRNNLTRKGRYRILDKIPNAYSDPWGFWMPYWMGIYYAGYDLENGFHSLPVLSNGSKLWGNKIGTPITYGCVVLLPDDMKKLYRWANVGTAVVIQK